ncbi:hypothetical protein COU37_02100 [Candidatus Micrarchaeota archaeon CG10_big_fil_rev_8_21_14_0_10_45_29]|nr:MAG: hypothetical protein COU37_02100 [Candidatus Micrarchaeota archaeon CG10_big_fil_rev_8_21_14_0_10_45_29]
MAKLILFSIFAALFLAGILFSAPCSGDNRVCAPGNIAKKCVSGEWVVEECAIGCFDGECMQCEPGEKECASPTKYNVCEENGKWTIAVPCDFGEGCDGGKCSQYTPIECREEGDVRCSWDNEDIVLICNKNLTWVNYQYCEKGCAGEGWCAQCEKDARECTGDVSYKYCKESRNWSSDVICTDGRVCEAGQCVPAGGALCKEGESKCASNSIFVCDKKGGWEFERNCLYGDVCIQAYNGAQCGSGLEKCFGWGEFEQYSKEEGVQYANDGRQRDCENITYRKYCLDAEGKSNLDEFEEKSEITCGEFYMKCEYKKKGEITFQRMRDGWAANCTSVSYEYVCKDSGIDASKEKEETQCGEWVQAEPQKEKGIIEIILSSLLGLFGIS